MSALLSLVPGIGPVLAAASAAWSFVASPVGRVLAVAAGAFIGGWQAKAHRDEAATLRTVISRQRIDIAAAQRTADDANAIIADIAQRDARNQEIISGQQLELSKRQAGACGLDPAAARGLRRLK